jgi:hypothetical protein
MMLILFDQLELLVQISLLSLHVQIQSLLRACASHGSGRLLFLQHGVVISSFEDQLSMAIISSGKDKTHHPCAHGSSIIMRSRSLP